jgi:cytochrome c553
MKYLRTHLLAWTTLLLPAFDSYGNDPMPAEQVYRQQCADCHGKKGEGVKGEYKSPLIGDWSLVKLTKYIDKNMPEDEPEKVAGKDAERVAKYIFDAFYSPEAQLRNNPPKVTMAHLTTRQQEETLAYLVAELRGQLGQLPDERGLNAIYFNDRNYNSQKKVLERIDEEVNFDFAEGIPEGAEFDPTAFSIRWQGSLLAEETGIYEIFLETENGCRLWLNDENDNKFIDGWVSSGIPTIHKASIRLLGGHTYPIRLDFFKFKDKRASIKLLWKPPNGGKVVVPTRNLIPQNKPPVFVLNTTFPPDDTSSGYPRGTLVSRNWAEATTFAALETAMYIIQNLNRFAGTKPEANDYQAKLAAFCTKFVRLAFRRPLTEEEVQKYVNTPLSSADSPVEGVKQSIMQALCSPIFLYPMIDENPDDHHDIANRLSIALLDSLPDRTILGLADQKQLQNHNILRSQAERMLKDRRARSKLQDFFYHWLELHHVESVPKDPKHFPEFDKALIADLRTSLKDFIDQIVWETPDADFRELLKSDHIYANARIAQFYNLEPENMPQSGRFVSVKLDSEHRSGLLTHPYLLAQFAYAHNSSPIHRGVFVTRSILGRHLQPPPEAVEFEEDDFPDNLTLREKIEKLTEPQACKGCHSIINPLGFSLENFDAVGRYRTTILDKPVETRSPYTSLSGEIIELNTARDIANYAANSPHAQKAFVKRLFQHYTKQPIEAFGPKTTEKLHKSFQDNNFNIRELIVEISILYATMPDLKTKP